MPEVTVKNLSKTFGDNAVLKDVTFTIKDGEFFTLLGASGCGKSTTLNCIAGLEQPTNGAISVGGTTFVDTDDNVFLPPEERNLGMVFQSYALWPHMTVAKNLALPLNIRKVPKDKQKTAHRRGTRQGRPGRPQPSLPAPALRWPAAARRPGSSLGLLPVGPAARRAALQPRRQASGTGSRLAQAPAGGPRHHHGLRHPRPGRSARAQRPDRGDGRPAT